jgi:hypothetical protein
MDKYRLTLVGLLLRILDLGFSSMYACLAHHNYRVSKL